MWDEARQARLDHLRETEAQGRLTEPERTELAALVAERLRYEEGAIEAATARIQSESAAMEAQLRFIEEQNRELEALVQEQESYLSDVERLLAQMETRRRSWRERYAQVTGKPFEEPAVAKPAP